MCVLPCGRPALSAARIGPIAPAHPGDDQEQFQIEREFPEDALGPAHSAHLRARRPYADPQARSPLFLPGARAPFL